MTVAMAARACADPSVATRMRKRAGLVAIFLHDLLRFMPAAAGGPDPRTGFRTAYDAVLGRDRVPRLPGPRSSSVCINCMFFCSVLMTAFYVRSWGPLLLSSDPSAFTFPAREGAGLHPCVRVRRDTREQDVEAFSHRRVREDRIAKRRVR